MGKSRNEDILENMLGAHNELGEPKSRIEALLMQLLEQGGGGTIVIDSELSKTSENAVQNKVITIQLAAIAEALAAKATMKNVLSPNDRAWRAQFESEWGGKKDYTYIDVEQEDSVELKVQSTRFGDTRIRVLPTKGYVDNAVKERYLVGEELLVGEWVDVEGTHNLYRKVIDFGALTNATQKTVPHGITSPFVVTKITGVASVSDRSNNLPLPFAANDPTKSIYLAVGRNNVTITPSSDRSNYTATVVIEYYRPSA